VDIGRNSTASVISRAERRQKGEGCCAGIVRLTTGRMGQCRQGGSSAVLRLAFGALRLAFCILVRMFSF
jgi:hypothetical protein